MTTEEADEANTDIAGQCSDRLKLIAGMLNQVDEKLGDYHEPEGAWTFGDDTPHLLAGLWLTLKDLQSDLILVTKHAEALTIDAADGNNVNADGRSFKASGVAKRVFEPEQKQALRDVIVRNIARTVALNPLTGELDEDRAQVAAQTIDTLDNWITLDPSKAKSGPLKKAGVDLGQYSTSTWHKQMREVFQ